MFKDFYIFATIIILLLIGLSSLPKKQKKKKLLKAVILLIVGYIFFFCLIPHINFPSTNTAKKLVTYIKLEELRKTVEKIKKFQDCYPEKIEKVTDAWGHDVIYQCAGDKFVIVSAGEDGKFGTNDDIKLGSLTFRGEFYEKPQKVYQKFHLVKKQKKVCQSPEVIFDLTYPDNIYIAAVNYYQKNPFATVVIRTKSQKIENVKISLSFDKNYFQEVVSTIPVLSQETPQQIYFHLVPNKDIFSIENSTTVLISLNLNYYFDNLSYSTQTTKVVTIYPKNMIDWNNPEMIACFVSETTIAEKILDRFSEIALTPVIKAAIFYYTLKSAQFEYTKEIKEEINPLSKILSSKKGNCSELTTFYLSLLHSSNTRTVALVSDKHVWCGFALSSGKGYDITQGLTDAALEWAAEKIKNWLFPPKPEPEDVVNKCRVDKEGKKYLLVNISLVGEKEKLFTHALITGWNLYNSCDVHWIDILAAKEKGYTSIYDGENLQFTIPDRRRIENVSQGELQKFFNLKL